MSSAMRFRSGMLTHILLPVTIVIAVLVAEQGSGDESGPASTVPLTRAEMEALVQPILDRCAGPVRRAIKDAGLTAADLSGSETCRRSSTSSGTGWSGGWAN